MEDENDSILYSNVFEPLVRKGRDGAYIPAAAQSYEQSADGLTWTFHLRHEAQWQDGKPVTAQDFVYAWKRLLTSENDSYKNFLALQGVSNAQQILEGKMSLDSLGVVAKDDYTLEVHLENPVPWFDTVVSQTILAPLRKDLISAAPHDWYKAGKIIGNGAFQIVGRNSFIIDLVKAPTYWDHERVALTEVQVFLFQNTQDAIDNYADGKLDSFHTHYREVAQAFQDRRKNVIAEAQNQESFIVIDVEKVSNVEVRKALAMLVPHENVVADFYSNDRLGPSGLQDSELVRPYEWEKWSMTLRGKQAREILAQQGYTPEHPLKLTYISSKLNVGLDFALDYQSKLVDKAVVFDPIEIGNEEYLTGNFQPVDLTYHGWIGDYEHISTYTNLFTCASTFTKYCNPEYDALLERAKLESQAQVRQELYAQAAQIINDQVPVIYWGQPVMYYIYNTNLAGYTSTNLKNLNWKDLYFVEQTEFAMHSLMLLKLVIIFVARIKVIQ